MTAASIQATAPATVTASAVTAVVEFPQQYQLREQLLLVDDDFNDRFE